MTTTYRLNDETISGQTSEELVHRLRSISWQEYNSDEEYMTAMAQRTKIQTGCSVRIDSDDNFIADLVSAGILVKG